MYNLYNLYNLYNCLVALLAQIPDWSASHIYREVNKRSDFLCNVAWDENASWCLQPERW